MPKKGSTTDLFMNWMDVSVTSDAANSSTLVEGQVKTGLSVRGQMAYEIHKVEFYPADTSVANSIQTICICTEADLATMPNLGDKGVICKMRERLMYAGAAFAHGLLRPIVWKSEPATPLAAPNISIYYQTAADEAALRSQTIEARIGFTTIPLDSQVLMEIAETWGY